MYSIAWIPSENCEGQILRQMAHGAEIEYYSATLMHDVTEYFDVDDYVILVDVEDISDGSELEGE